MIARASRVFLAGELARWRCTLAKLAAKAWIKKIECFTHKPFLLAQAERIKKQAGVMASQAGGPSGT
jgi:hypothetical protein